MAYVRNAWYVAAWAHEVDAGPRGLCILNEPIVLWRSQAGELTAFEDRCIHRLAPLSMGRCDGDTLRCKYHGLVYDRSGSVVEIPGQSEIPAKLRVRTYPVVERYGWVWIWMGDKAADESLLPSLIEPAHPSYIFAYGELDYAAEARLIIDNLLDLSHVSFLHTESFKVSGTWAREHPRVTPYERGIRSERWFKSEGINASVNADRLVDTFFCYDFFVPGVLLMTTRTYAVGTADSLDGCSPDPDEDAEAVTAQAITPVSDKSARYYYIMGRRRGGLVDSDNAQEALAQDMTTVSAAFAEDKAMIEAQQRIIDLTPNWRFRPIAADRSISLFNRISEKLARDESVTSTIVDSNTPTQM